MPTTVRVVHVGTADNSGGAARASFRIHTGLLSLGISSSMLCGQTIERTRPEVACIPAQNTLWQRAFKLAVNKLEETSGLEYELLPWKKQFMNHAFLKDANVVHLHNLHGGFFPTDCLRPLGRSKSLVWSLHDLWPLTGHCYYPGMFDCERWKTGCGVCPGLRQDDHYPLSIDTTAHLWERKRKIYSSLPVTLVAQSRWTLDQIGNSPLLSGKPVRLIPYGLDIEMFRPMEKDLARDLLHIPRDSKVLFFSAIGLNSPRKGWSYLKEALKKVRSTFDGQLVILMAGYLDPSERLDSDVPVVSLGYVADDRIMMLAYNSADLFVGASLLETFGLVFLEAAACSVPSVAFDTSGVRDVVRHMDTGYLASFKSSEDLTNGILLLLTDDVLRERMGRHGRAMVVQEYSLALQAARFADLYGEMLEARHFDGEQKTHTDG